MRRRALLAGGAAAAVVAGLPLPPPASVVAEDALVAARGHAAARFNAAVDAWQRGVATPAAAAFGGLEARLSDLHRLWEMERAVLADIHAALERFDGVTSARAVGRESIGAA